VTSSSIAALTPPRFAYLIGMALVSTDPEPPVGSAVRIDGDGTIWCRDEHSPACWTRVDGSEPETWTHVAGNRGPVTLLNIGEGEWGPMPEPGELDLGNGVTARFTRWAPNRSIEANRLRYEGLPDVDPWGLILNHPLASSPTGRCEGALTFAGPVQDLLAPNDERWTVESLDPLTLSPSLLCACGFHGYIREGRWVPA
jgi:hypothetical protein